VHDVSQRPNLRHLGELLGEPKAYWKQCNTSENQFWAFGRFAIAIVFANTANNPANELAMINIGVVRRRHI